MYWPYATSRPINEIRSEFMKWLVNHAPHDGWHFEFEDGKPEYEWQKNGPYPTLENKVVLCYGEKRTNFHICPMAGDVVPFFASQLLVRQPQPDEDTNLDVLIIWLQSMPKP